MRRSVAMIAIGVLSLVGCGSTSDSVPVSATTRATVPTESGPRAASDAPYKFIKPPLVVVSRANSSRAVPLFQVMVRVRPPLPRRTNPNRANTFGMQLDGASSTNMARLSDECYSASFDRSMAESGGPQNPPPEIFVRPRAGKKVTVSVLYRPGRGEKFRSFSAEVEVRRPSRALWDGFDRLGLKQQGCKQR